jgi:hypothetical protein
VARGRRSSSSAGGRRPWLETRGSRPAVVVLGRRSSSSVGDSRLAAGGRRPRPAVVVLGWRFAARGRQSSSVAGGRRPRLAIRGSRPAVVVLGWRSSSSAGGRRRRLEIGGSWPAVVVRRSRRKRRRRGRGCPMSIFPAWRQKTAPGCPLGEQEGMEAGRDRVVGPRPPEGAVMTTPIQSRWRAAMNTTLMNDAERASTLSGIQKVAQQGTLIPPTRRSWRTTPRAPRT